MGVEERTETQRTRMETGLGSKSSTSSCRGKRECIVAASAPVIILVLANANAPPAAPPSNPIRLPRRLIHFALTAVLFPSTATCWLPRGSSLRYHTHPPLVHYRMYLITLGSCITGNTFQIFTAPLWVLCVYRCYHSESCRWDRFHC